jgi:hypothetical protein
VPKDLRISGDEETFTATISFDTRELFGKFDATYEIKLNSPQEKKDEKKTEKSRPRVSDADVAAGWVSAETDCRPR